MKTTFDFSTNDASKEVGEFVLRSGKVFECGEYADKKFSLTEAEADDAIAHFTPTDVCHEHGYSIFDGLLGKVNKIWRQGLDVMAEWQFPKELHNLFGGKPMKVSAEWDTFAIGKRLTGCALVMEPRVRDAAMMTAFAMSSDDVQKMHILTAMQSAFKDKPGTYHGKQAIQEGHDHTARHGAICTIDTPDTKKSKMALFTTKPEMKVLQTAHDAFCAGGAMCGNPYPTYNYSEEKNMNEEEKKSLWGRIKSAIFGEGYIEPKEGEQPLVEKTAEEKAALFNVLLDNHDAKVKEIADSTAPVVIPVTETVEFKAQKTLLDNLIEGNRVREEADKALFAVSNAAAIEQLITDFKIDPKDRDTEIKVRADNPAVYDHFALRLTDKFAGTRVPSPDTISGEKALEIAGSDEVTSKQFTNTVAAIRSLTPSL